MRNACNTNTMKTLEQLQAEQKDLDEAMERYIVDIPFDEAKLINHLTPLAQKKRALQQQIDELPVSR